MGEPAEHIPVKLIVGLIARQNAQFTLAKGVLEKKYGKIDRETPILDFSRTRYYEEEFGENLKRKFLSFEKPVTLRKNYRIKLYTNRIEKTFTRNNKRAINIDPGYLSLTKLVLFTTKARSHRVYIERGIYADVELMFSGGTFHALRWAYPDFKTKEYIAFFDSVRAGYLSQIRKYLSKESRNAR